MPRQYTHSNFNQIISIISIKLNNPLLYLLCSTFLSSRLYVWYGLLGFGAFLSCQLCFQSAGVHADIDINDSDEFQALGYFLYEAVKIDVHIISFKRSGISICVCKRIGHGLNGGRVGGEHRLKRRRAAFINGSTSFIRGGNELMGVAMITVGTKNIGQR